jgi:DNA-binding CsgD family transcriptional regulator/tetratricopeptide (TPR) repeat protein
MARHLVERTIQLETLQTAVGRHIGTGGVVVVAGEAGHGKTSLVSTFVERLDHRYRPLVAACEPVGIPAAFSPLYDLFDDLPDELTRDIRDVAGRPAVYSGMYRLVRRDPVVLVIEDLQWADEATLGLIRHLGRRIDATASTLVVTYRPEEIHLTHPLRLVLASLRSATIRIDLPPLSVAGVTEMTRGLELDPAEVHQATLGNPFFVEEITRHPDLRVPPSVESAVLANAAMLPAEALPILQMIALSPDGLDVESLTASSPTAAACLDLALQRRLLAISDIRISCRHDLIRESLIRSMPPILRLSLHRHLLEMLEARASGSVVTARMAYHAVGAANPDKAVAYSLQAARDAARLGAHRQASFHYANALNFATTIEIDDVDVVLLEAARERSAINDFSAAVDLARQRVELANGVLETGKARSWLAFFMSRENDLEGCRYQAELAIKALRGTPVSEELALALAVVAWADLVQGRPETAIRHGTESIGLARSAGTPHVEVHAATTTGLAKAFFRDPTGVTEIERAVRMGLEAGLGEFTARAMNARAIVEQFRGRPAEAHESFDVLVDYAQTNQLDAWYIASVATRATLRVMLGRWEEADTDLETVLGQPTCRQTEIETLITAARLAARRGDPGALAKIDAALESVENFNAHYENVLACALALEAAWLGIFAGDRAEGRYRALLDSPAVANDLSARGLLGYWAIRLDLDPPPGELPGPVGLESSGRPGDASRSWEERGYPVEAIVTGAMVPNADLDTAFSRLSELRAEGVKRGLRRELSRRGARQIPREKWTATRNNPAGLTPRQVEVLALLVSGMSNAAIADELYISEKTAGHHVSAILSKLNVPNRTHAAAMAATAEWIDSG